MDSCAARLLRQPADRPGVSLTLWTAAYDAVATSNFGDDRVNGELTPGVPAVRPKSITR